jgi:hypothetical protein
MVLERLAGSLLHFFWQGAAIAILAALALKLLERRPAEWRYAAASAALLAMLAAPNANAAATISRCAPAATSWCMPRH